VSDSEKYKHSVPSSSAIYRVIDNMVLNKGNLAFKISNIFPDKNGLNIPIQNEERIKSILFDEIKRRYNNRIREYKLVYSQIQDKDLSKFEIEQYSLFSSDNSYGISGEYEVFPRTFYCNKCGDFRSFNSEKAIKYWQSFNQNKCSNENCSGQYSQLSLLLYCEYCGIIRPLEYYCGESGHGYKYIKLNWKEKDSLSTWKVVCEKCLKENKRSYIDIFRLTCKHKDEENKIILNFDKMNDEERKKKKSNKYTTLSIKEGGIYTPVVLTHIDMPNLGELNLENQEFLYLCYFLNKFNKNDFDFEDFEELNIESIKEFIDDYHQTNKKRRFIERKKRAGKTEEEAQELWKEENYMHIIEKEIETIKKEYPNISIQEINEFLALKGVFSEKEEDLVPVSFTQFINQIENEDEKKILRINYESLFSNFSIEEITYVPKINIISSCIGLINGVNKFYEEGFIPHFEPIWYNKIKREKFKAYVYPFKSEGIIIEVDKIRLCNWLIENEFLDIEFPHNKEEAVQIIMNLEKGSTAYEQTEILLHTYSHLLLNRSKLHTGLDSESCGEMIFVNNGAFLVFSNSSINIGGFLFVFENAIKDWFNEIQYDAEECTFDPTCLYEKGSCFSCLYLPEFVCTNLNKNLDRDVFLGRKRYKTSFWRIKGV